MTTPFTTPDGALEAERLLELFDREARDEFGEAFRTADSATIGALIGFTHQAIRALSLIEGDSPADIRRMLRATIAEVAGSLIEEAESDG